MSEKDKYVFGVQCGARWACLPPVSHTYHDVCPQGWELQFGETCSAPVGYSGPCEHVVDMVGMTTAEKKRFEATCEVSWPDAPSECTRDYAAPCPFGWLQTGSECRAPLGYTGCN